VFPALVINYFGQGALILHDPTTIDNPFFHLAPPWATLPLVGHRDRRPTGSLGSADAKDACLAPVAEVARDQMNELVHRGQFMLKGRDVAQAESSTPLHDRAYLYEGRDNVSEAIAHDLGLRPLQCGGSDPRN
jgi:hypothetical protein